MRLYRSTLLAVLIGASSIGSSSTVNAQSFDYPKDSKSIFSRWADRNQAAMPQVSPQQKPAPQATASPQAFSLKRLIGSETKLESSTLVKRIRAFDSRKAFSLATRPASAFPANQQANQTSWAQPWSEGQVERSILEVVGEQPKIDPSQPRYQLDSYETIPSIDFPAAAAKVAAAPSSPASVAPAQVTPEHHADPRARTAVNHRTAAHPLSINEAQRKSSGLTTTQAMLERRQMRDVRTNENASITQVDTKDGSRFAKGSFENEFKKAYSYLDTNTARDLSFDSKAVTGPSARVAQRTAVKAINVSHAALHPGSSSSTDSEFDLIPESDGELKLPELPPIGDFNEIAPGEFTPPAPNERGPNENPEFAPPANMSFEVPGTTEALDAPQRQPDLLPPIDSAPPAAQTNMDISESDFALVKTTETWVAPVLPIRTTPNDQNYSAEAEQLRSAEANDAQVVWWKALVDKPLHSQNTAMPISTNGLVLEALRNSPRIKAVSKTPLIRELQVVEADAEFDTVTFLKSQFQDRNDPVGNSLTTGGEPFLRDNIWNAETGIRKKLRNGGDYSLSQTLGFQNSNSTFFVPQDQGTATLALNVTQPLLRGRGNYVNQAQILIAQSTGGAAWDTFKADLQVELEGMVSAYWDLYLQRSIFLQKKRNVERGQVMLDRLKGREELDSLPAQIARAKSAVLTRRTELANAFRDVRDAETEIRRRIADKNWQASQSIELLPAEMPFAQSTGLELEQVVYTALENRPEIAEAIRRIRIAGVQRDVSANELLPDLSLLLGTYVSSLRGDTGILNAFQDQFGQVKPGYSVGIEFELPYRNRAARSRLQQRNLQFRRLQNELEDVIQNVIAESQVATRQVSSALETLHAAKEAVGAARVDLVQNRIRWESFALTEGDLADGQSPTVVLDQLLDSQERLSQAENVFAQAERELKVAEVGLQRIMGTLLMHQQVDFSRTVGCDVPAIHINKADTSPEMQYNAVQHQSAPNTAW